MAQTGFTPIQLYSSSTPTNAPAAGNLTNDTKGSELAVNIADGKLFYKDTSNNVQTIADKTWVGTVTNVSALTIGTTGTDLSSTVANPTSTPVITLNVPTASASNRGALSSTDWSTFNNKQAALVSGTNIKTVNGTTLLGSGDLGTIGVGYGGTGLTSLTAGYIPYGNGTSAFSSSANLYFSGRNLGVGTSSPTDFGAGYTNTQINGTTGSFLSLAVNGTRTGYMYSDASGTEVGNITAGFYRFYVNGATRLNVASGGDVTVNTGNLVIGTSGKGIDFSATAGSGTSELLNDYEEGTWTPTISSASGVCTFVSGSGTYTKIGRMVYISVSVRFSTDASVGTSTLTIGGLPFASTAISIFALVSTDFSFGDYGTGGANGLANIGGSGSSFTHLNRTVDISSRAAFSWGYAGYYQAS
jgi:hypothetical protein